MFVFLMWKIKLNKKNSSKMDLEYTDRVSCKEVRPPTHKKGGRPGYDTKLHSIVRLVFQTSE